MIQETIRTPLWFAVFWVEASADPNAQSGAVAIAGAPPKIAATLSPLTPLPRGTPGAQSGGQGAATGATMVANDRGLLFQTLPVSYAAGQSEDDLSQLPTAPQLPSGQSVISVSLVSLDGRYNPRVVNLKPPTTLATFGLPSTVPAPIYVGLRPSLQGTRISESGALAINLQWSRPASGPPVPASWAVVTLTCTRTGVNYGFTGQADINGDVIVPLTGLPPLPPSQTSDTMNLSVYVDIRESGVAQGCDTDALLAMNPTPVIGTVAKTGASASVPSLSITRGKINTAATLGYTSFTLQAPQGSP
jgi:hypothetical protein